MPMSKSSFSAKLLYHRKFVGLSGCQSPLGYNHSEGGKVVLGSRAWVLTLIQKVGAKKSVNTLQLGVNTVGVNTTQGGVNTLLIQLKCLHNTCVIHQARD